MIDDDIGAEPEVRAAQVLRHSGMSHRHALHVTLVDHGPVPRYLQSPIVAPSERRIDDDALRHAAGRVAVVALEILIRVAQLVREERVAPLQRASDGAGVRVEEELGRVEAVALIRVIRAMHAISIQLTGPHVREIAVPDLIGAIANLNVLGLRGVVGATEQAQLYTRRALREEREVDTHAVPRCSEGVRLSTPNAHSCFLQ